MSGKLGKYDQIINLGRNLSEFEEAGLIAAFEHNVDIDIYEYNVERKESKALKRLSIFKTILFPIEYPLTFLFLGKSVATERYHTQQIYWQFLFTKMDVSEFKYKLNNVFKNSNIIR